MQKRKFNWEKKCLLRQFKKNSMKLTGSILLVLIISSCMGQRPIWADRMAATVMKTYPDSIVVKKYVTHGKSEEKIEEAKPSRPATWDYEQGVVLRGFDELWRQTGNRTYFDYMKKMMDLFVQEDGTIRTYDLIDYNIDDITPGRVLLSLYKETKEEKYRKAADLLREQLRWQPRTKEGGFWHKHIYPYQMWLDGLYMGGPFYAEYTTTFNNGGDLDDVINQFVWVEKHTRDERTGLLYHGWDESRKQRWANAQTGQSPEFWSRGMGWYAMALVDLLDYVPANHPRRKEVIDILQRLATGLKNYQDAQTGVWFQITNKPTTEGNYREASASAMFVYAIARGARLGYLDKSYDAVARKGFDGMISTFIQTDDSGTAHLLKTCSGAGLGGKPYRDGSFAYYIKEPLRTDDLKGIGPFMLASIEIELLKK
jgi:rhamnogalacturonyl hydrolase YesR